MTIVQIQRKTMINMENYKKYSLNYPQISHCFQRKFHSVAMGLLKKGKNVTVGLRINVMINVI